MSLAFDEYGRPFLIIRVSSTVFPATVLAALVHLLLKQLILIISTSSVLFIAGTRKEEPSKGY